MIYISFHGGDVSPAINNVFVYDVVGGKPVRVTTAALQTPAGSPPLSELRDLVFGPAGHLYVVNGYRNESQVLVYDGTPGADGSHPYLGIYADASVSKAVAHPFALAFDASGNGYLSSQDSNVVTGLKPLARKKPSAALPVAAYLAGLKKTMFLRGTMVASSVGKLAASPKHAPSSLGRPQGLDVVLAADASRKHPKRMKVAHSVRDVLVVGDSLYVADEPGNCVKIYDLRSGPGRGQLQGQIAAGAFLQAPVHLLVNGDHLYIGSSGTDTVLQYHLTTGALETVVQGVKTISGMCFDDAGNFYVAPRDDKAIYTCGQDFGTPELFVGAATDSEFIDCPEFVVFGGARV